MITLRTWVGIASALWMAPLGAEAQDLPLVTPGTPLPVCRFDSSAVVDTSDFTLFLTPPRSNDKARRQADRYLPYINAIASAFEQPRHLSVSHWPEGADTVPPVSEAGDCDAWCVIGPLEGEVQFRLRNARATGVSWWLVPDSPEVMRALERAIHAADSLHLFPSDPRLDGLPKATVRLALHLARWPPAMGGVPIGRVRLPVVRDIEPVEIVFQPTPYYPVVPPELQSPRVVVSLQYVVAESGFVPDETIRVLRADHSAFVRPAVEAIVRSRFRPATAGGCPVRQRVQQRVVFRR